MLYLAHFGHLSNTVRPRQRLVGFLDDTASTTAANTDIAIIRRRYSCQLSTGTAAAAVIIAVINSAALLLRQEEIQGNAGADATSRQLMRPNRTSTTGLHAASRASGCRFD